MNSLRFGTVGLIIFCLASLADSVAASHGRTIRVSRSEGSDVENERPTRTARTYRRRSIDQMMQHGFSGVPRPRRFVSHEVVQDPGMAEPVVDEVYPEELVPHHGHPIQGGPVHAGDCGGCGGCDVCGPRMELDWFCLLPVPVIPLSHFEFQAGVHGFTGPMNRGGTGSFGVHEGFNLGFGLPFCGGCGMGGQIGVQGVHSNFEGAEFTENPAQIFTIDDSRNQLFVTAAVFRRVDWGVQFGLALDYQQDSWHYDVSISQLRGELSWVYPCAHEVGLWFNAGTNTDTYSTTFAANNRVITGRADPTDIFAIFYRHRFSIEGEPVAKFSAGVTDASDGLLNADVLLPFSPSWGLRAGATWLIPRETSGRGGQREEAWNVSLSLVWYPGQRLGWKKDYYRPLFDVADNGTFLVDR